MAPEQVALPLSAPGSLSVFRYTDYDVPFWARPNSRSGRWNVAGDDVPTQYWCMTPDGAWAELIRAKELNSEAELDMVRMPLWVCRIPTMLLTDMLHAEAQETYGVSLEQMIGDDWAPCQAAAAELRRRCRGVITPNAALDGHTRTSPFSEPGERSTGARRLRLARQCPPPEQRLAVLHPGYCRMFGAGHPLGRRHSSSIRDCRANWRAPLIRPVFPGL